MSQTVKSETKYRTVRPGPPSGVRTDRRQQGSLPLSFGPVVRSSPSPGEVSSPSSRDKRKDLTTRPRFPGLSTPPSGSVDPSTDFLLTEQTLSSVLHQTHLDPFLGPKVLVEEGTTHPFPLGLSPLSPWVKGRDTFSLKEHSSQTRSE